MAYVTNIPMSEVMKGLTLSIEVTGRHRARARIFAGVAMIRLAAWVMGVGASCIAVDIAAKDTDHG